jgi:hypothetical protein
MNTIIQEYLKKINSKISLVDIYSILITTLFILGFIVYLYISKIESPVTYIKSNEEPKTLTNNSLPFASVNGNTYTFAWCQGANVIKIKNRIYFTNENGAQQSGRSLSKLCQK